MRDIYEVANQLGGFVGPSTDKFLAKFLIREAEEATALANEIVRLRQLLSDAEKGFDRAWIIPGPGDEYRMITRPPVGDEAPSVSIVYRTLQSEER